MYLTGRTLSTLFVERRDLEIHLPRAARAASINVGSEKFQNLGSSFRLPRFGVGDFAAIRHHQWIGQRVLGNFGFVVVWCERFSAHRMGQSETDTGDNNSANKVRL